MTDIGALPARHVLGETVGHIDVEHDRLIGHVLDEGADGDGGDIAGPLPDLTAERFFPALPFDAECIDRL